jgi:hypothetical protein
MREFFRGWRRKVGVGTLVMACLLMGIWIRCPLNIDSIEIEIGSSIVTLASNQHGVWFVKSDLPDSQYYPSRLRGRSNGFTLPGRRRAFSDDPFGHLRDWDWESHSRSVWHGFHFARYCKKNPINGMHLSFSIVPHWTIILPLTLLSAYLILWKPRTKVERDA